MAARRQHVLCMLLIGILPTGRFGCMAGTTAKQRPGFEMFGSSSPGHGALSTTMLLLHVEGRRTLPFGYRALPPFGCMVAGQARSGVQTCGATTHMHTAGRNWNRWHQAGLRQPGRIMWRHGTGQARRSGCMVATMMLCWEIFGN